MDSYFIYYGITAIAFFISSLAQAFVMGTYNKFAKVENNRGMSGKEAAGLLLNRHNLSNVSITQVGGTLSDHYDPRKKVIRLSNSIYSNDSISSVAVACHECGHAIQDKEGYLFMRIRAKLVPLVNFCSYAGYIAIMIGLLAGLLKIVIVGIVLECVILLFQLITLPVEFDASKRALDEIKQTGILDLEEHKKAKRVLTAAALTYVASVASTLLQILRLVLMFTRRRR